MLNKPEAEQPVNPFQQLQGVVSSLRGEQGCPWDRRQTPASLKKYLLEEATELAEAIDQGNPRHICEEAGDLYFILALLAAIFEEQGSFSTDDALTAACAKMVRRHPHVFAAIPGETDQMCEKQLRNQWKRIKQEEKAAVQETNRE